MNGRGVADSEFVVADSERSVVFELARRRIRRRGGACRSSIERGWSTAFTAATLPVAGLGRPRSVWWP